MVKVKLIYCKIMSVLVTCDRRLDTKNLWSKGKNINVNCANFPIEWPMDTTFDSFQRLCKLYMRNVIIASNAIPSTQSDKLI